MPLVAVLMAAHNSGHLLLHAARSILAQEGVDLELWIMDDGSTDSTWQVAGRLQRSDSRVRALRQPNRGLGESLNHLLRVSAAPLVARMDSDDVSPRWRLRAQAAYLARRPEVGVVSGWNVRFSDRGSVFFCECYPDDHDWIRRALEGGLNPIVHPAVMMRREVLERVTGPYRFRFVQDLDLWLRLLPITRFGIVQRACHLLRVHSAQVSGGHAERKRRFVELSLRLHARRQLGLPEGTVAAAQQTILDRSASEAGAPYDQDYLEGMAALLAGRSSEAREHFSSAIAAGSPQARRARRWRAVARLPGTYGLIRVLLGLRNPLMRFQRPLETACSPGDRQEILRLLRETCEYVRVGA